MFMLRVVLVEVPVFEAELLPSCSSPSFAPSRSVHSNEQAQVYPGYLTAEDILYGPFPFLYCGVTVDAEAGMTALRPAYNVAHYACYPRCMQISMSLWSRCSVTLPEAGVYSCLLYTSPSPRDGLLSRMPSSA